MMSDPAAVTVTVYAVEEGGATGALLGSGRLVEANAVLVHPPLDGVLAGRDGPVRVAVVSDGGSAHPERAGFAEVIDAHVDVVEREPLLVLLELARDSTATPSGPMVPFDPEDPAGLLHITRADVVAALRPLIADPPRSPLPVVAARTSPPGELDLPEPFPPAFADDVFRMIACALRWSSC